jgi:Pvc16 N-terminal domain
MLNDLQNAIRSLVYTRGQIPEADVDVRFDTPTRDWIRSLIRPTVSAFLYDVQENLDLRYTNFQTRREGSRSFTKADPRLFDFRFMVSVISSEVEDEHAVLYRVLHVLLKQSEIPADLLPESLTGSPVGVLCRVDQPSETSSRLTDIWSALDVPPRPAVAFVVTLPVDTEDTIETPLVLTRNVRYRPTVAGVGSLEGLGYHIGGVLKDANGDAIPGLNVALEGTAQEIVSDPEGRFVFYGVHRGPITLRVDTDSKPQSFKLEVPSPSYDLKLE